MQSRFAALLVGVALAASVMPVAGATAEGMVLAQTGSSERVELAAITPLPMQFFCARNKSQCANGDSGQVQMTPNLLALLKQVNTGVNRAIAPEPDTADIWELNPASGDCEDYVLTKRSALIQQGVPSGALRIAYTHTRSGQAHTILLVRTSDGDYVLDNLTGSVQTLRASGYVIRSMSSPNPTRWTTG